MSTSVTQQYDDFYHLLFVERYARDSYQRSYVFKNIMWLNKWALYGFRVANTVPVAVIIFQLNVQFSIGKTVGPLTNWALYITIAYLVFCI